MPTNPGNNNRSRSSQRVARPSLKLNMQFATPRTGLPGPECFRRWAIASLIDNVDVTIRLVDRDEGLALNSAYRHRSKPTNVLTFAYPETSPLSGDIVLCVPVVKDEARAQGKAVEAHLAHLTVHGMLHLQGFDHHTAQEAELMEGLETEILGKLGYADPYAGTPA